MTAERIKAYGEPLATARLRQQPEDFRVDEELGFEPSGEGEHVFLHLEKRQLNTQDVAQRLSTLSRIHPKDISFSGMKDRNAVTRQWFSVRMAGKPEPDWQLLAVEDELKVLAVARHQRKLKRGVHKSNRFCLILRDLEGDREAIEQRLQQIKVQGAPNYFGEQRFGHGGATLQQALAWMQGAGRRISRNKRSLFLSALRADLFNRLLAQRVEQGDWHQPQVGDVCFLQGTRSQFVCESVDDSILQRQLEGDLHPGLPLWGRYQTEQAPQVMAQYRQWLQQHCDVADFLVAQGLELGWRPNRLMADDFCWQFCDDSLQLDFRLSTGSYATSLLAEFVVYTQG